MKIINHFIGLILLVLLVQSSAYGQFTFVPSRFQYDISPTCSTCDTDDGILHWHFDLDSIRIIDATESEPAKLQITIQNRFSRTVSTIASNQRVEALNMPISSNIDAFTDLTDSCEVEFSPDFRATSEGGRLNATYNRVIANANFGGVESAINITMTAADTFNLFRGPFVDRDQIVSVGATFQDTYTLTCDIQNNNQEAGFAFNASVGFTGSSFRLYTDPTSNAFADVIQRTASQLADNDLRGFRLDGKTWAQDYARYSDGAGVRLEFSKGIQTTLTSVNFMIEGSTATVSEVEHTAGESYANVVLSDPVSGGILRLVSPSDSAVMDADGTALADGNFLASLGYDADAPRVDSSDDVSARITTFNAEEQEIVDQDSGNNYSVREITFSSPISVATIDNSDICVTETERGSCVTEGTLPAVANIYGGSEDTVTTSTIRVLINEGDGSTASSGRSLEFRRNAMLGADYRVVEDYQTALRGIIDIADTQPPVITVTQAEATAADNNELMYTITFTVTANESVPTLNRSNSYTLLRIPRTGNAEEIIPDTQNISGNDRQATLTYTYTFTGDDADAAQAALSETNGFALARSSEDVLVDRSGNMPMVGTNGELDPNNDDAVAGLTQVLTCATFYPFINQTQLWLQVRNVGNPDPDGFKYTDDMGMEVEVPSDDIQVSSRVEDGETIYIVSITRPEIGMNSEGDPVQAIEVSYTPTTGGGAAEEETAMCRRSDLMEPNSTNNADGDDAIDIVDEEPFNPDNAMIIGGGLSDDMVTLVDANTGEYYSRSYLVRSLVRDEDLSYFDGREVQSVTPEITSVEYFGIEGSDARAFNLDAVSGSGCRTILEAAVARNISGVNMVEHCGANITDQFGSELPGTQFYVWVLLDGDGRLNSQPLYINSDGVSDRASNGVNVLPEINFSGQPSYLLLTNPRTRTVNISAYAGDSSVGDIDANVTIFTSDSGGTTATGSVSVSLMRESDAVSAMGTYDIGNNADSDAKLLAAGESATYWLSGLGIWSPTNLNTSAVAGGRDSSGDNALGELSYAVGANNNVEVQVAEAPAPESPEDQLIRIEQILLYNVNDDNNLELANRVVAGNDYFIVADYTAQTTAAAVVTMMLPEGYTADAGRMLSTTQTNIITDNDEITGTNIDAIYFMVGDIQTTTTIVVGWDSIGNVEDVTATYLAFPSGMGTIMDTDLDNIPNSPDEAPTDNTLLQSFAGINGADTGMNGNVLQSAPMGDKPLFMSDAGRNMAILSNTQFASANINYDTVSPAVDEEDDLNLPFLITQAAIEKLATFGVRDIDYSSIDDNGNPAGGIAYIVFPMQTEGDGEVRYLSKYNTESDRWERFERGDIRDNGIDYDDTWYAIDRGAPDAECPTDIEQYTNEHQADGTDDLGFTVGKGGWNCILVAVTDGGPYDSDGTVNGRVIDPTATSVELLTAGSFSGTARRGGGGGGAIGIADTLLLITALLMLIATARRQRKQSPSN
ncbi:MAG: hypothetical protein GDA45_01045 [Chromatiales bacterium]|nr:hypothetical protein [Chromatiales bacterium]